MTNWCLSLFVTGLIHWLSNSQKKSTLDFNCERFLYKNFFENSIFSQSLEKFSKSYYSSWLRKFLHNAQFSRNLCFFEKTYIVHNFSRSLIIVWLRKCFSEYKKFRNHTCWKISKISPRGMFSIIVYREHTLRYFSKSSLMLWLRKEFLCNFRNLTLFTKSLRKLNQCTFFEIMALSSRIHVTLLCFSWLYNVMKLWIVFINCAYV